MLPVDIVVNKGFPAGDTPVDPKVVPADQIPSDMMGLDIGPESCKLFHDKIVDSKTVVWNGPMGVSSSCLRGRHQAVAKALVDATEHGAFTIVAVVIPLRPCVSSDSPKMASRTSPRAAAPLSNSSRARSFLASRSSSRDSQH